MLSNGAINLPDEILSLVCQDLGLQRRFDTLFKCALSARSLADPSIRTLYQFHELSPPFGESDDVDIRQQNIAIAQKFQQAERFFRKWTVLWRSIVMSSLADSHTYKPYCRYLRVLDFRNLTQMLEDPRFRDNTKREFFAKGLKQFDFTVMHGRMPVINVEKTINAIGDAIIPKTSLLEEISGNLSSGFLTRWISFSPRLRGIVLFEGKALSSGAGASIAEHCGHFENLTIREWRGDKADSIFAQFLTDLKPDSLRYLEMISYNDLGQMSFEALGRHRSLRELKLGNLNQAAIEHLNALKLCTELHTLDLDDNFGTVPLETLNNDVFEDVIVWLSSCDKLRDLTVKRLFDGPSILAQVISSPNIRLTRLSLEGYNVRGSGAAAFHTALSEQRSLEALSLRGNGEDTVPEDLNIMVEAISRLENLKELHLRGVSDEFEDSHVIQLALCLGKLEEFWVSGDEFTSEVLSALANTPDLRSLTLYATTRLGSDELIDFFTRLDPVRQRGFLLYLPMVDPAYRFTAPELDIIQDTVRTRLQGRFEFELMREDSSDASDDD